MAKGFKKVPVMAWDFQNLFLWVPTPPKKMCQLWHGIFKTFFVGVNKKHGASYGMSISKPFFFGVVPAQKIGASYGIEISEPYYYLVVFPKNGASYGMEPALFLFEGLPKKKVAISGMESSPKNVPVMACFCPLFIFIWWFPPKKLCQLWHGNLFPYIYLGVDPFTYLYLVFYPQQPQPKTHLPTHPFFPKNHSCPCSSSWNKKCYFWQVEPLQASVL
jgi:hypothetical protein